MSGLNYLKLFIRRIKTAKHACYGNTRDISRRNGNFDPPLYTPDQVEYIIGTIHNCVLTNNTRAHLTEKRIQNLKPVFEQNPKLDSLEPLMYVSGMGLKSLRKICDHILYDSTRVNETVREADEELPDMFTNCSDDFNDSKKQRVPSNLLTPSNISPQEVESVVSIQLGINAISWCRVRAGPGQREVHLDAWNLVNLEEYVDKKYDIHSVWDMTLHLRDVIPDGDVYVLENRNWSNITNIKTPVKYHIQEAMLTTAICSVFNQTDSEREPRPNTNNRVYFLRTYTPYRLFRKVVGNERVSAQDVVQNMMDGVPDERHLPVIFTNGTAGLYLGHNGSLRDIMCRSLLLVVSFNELILQHNPAALSIIGKMNVGKKKA